MSTETLSILQKRQAIERGLSQYLPGTLLEQVLNHWEAKYGDQPSFVLNRFLSEICTTEELRYHRKDILALDVSSISNVADAIVIASGTSTRHIKALADNVAEEARKAGFRPLGVEGERDAEWILIDLGFVVVHVMLPTARRFYDLESLWRAAPEETVA